MDPGMTDNQWKDYLRLQLGNLEDIKQYLEEGREAEAIARLEREIKRIREGLES